MLGFSNKKWVRVLGCVLFALSSLGWSADRVLERMNFQSLPNEDLGVLLELSSPIQTGAKVFSLTQPPQLTVDLPGVRNGLRKTLEQGLGLIQQAVILEDQKRTRIVFRLKDRVTYAIKKSGRQIMLTLHANPGISPAERVSSEVKPAKRISSRSKTQGYVQDVDFQGDGAGGAKLILRFRDRSMPVDVKTLGDDVLLSFNKTGIEERWLRLLDVRDFVSPIEGVEISRKGDSVQLRLKARAPFEHVAYQVDRQFVLEARPIRAVTGVGAAQKQYKGKRLSLNFQDVQTRSVLQLLAEFSGINIVASDAVKGSVTLSLHNVPWDEALEIVLKTQGLAQRTMGDILLVGPSSDIAAREQAELQAQKAVEDLEPMQSELIQINYAKASDIIGLIKGQSANLLSKNGQISADPRTNSVWILDNAAKRSEVRKLVQKLDIPVRQVLIEARVVTVEKTYQHQLGVLFGLSHENMHLSGTFSGANSVEEGNTLASVGANRLNLNLPASSSEAPRVGLALARLGQGFLLDLELSALESTGNGELISSPRLITADQQAALIESGEEIPYESAASSGATVVSFKKAVLSLNVTPQITPDNKVMLKLTVHQDKRSTKPDVRGVPAIDTQSVETNVLVDNGETVVLGGIYIQDSLDRVKRVPFLGELPVVGHLFRNREKSNAHRELLIFVTPKIIQQSQGLA